MPNAVTDMPAQVTTLNQIGSIPGFGDAADRLIANDFDVGVLRPYLGRDGRSYVTRTINGKPRVLVSNAPATLTKDAWIIFDTAVVRAVRDRLRAFADIRGAGLNFILPNGMAHTMLQWQTVGDITPATISMDPARRSEADQPTLDIGNLPLPVIHKDFDFSARQIAVSRNGNVPLDTTTAEAAGRKVAEMVEQLTTGALTFTFGGATVYGYTNFPNRATKTDMPVPDGTNGTAVINAILALRQILINNKHYGPYMFYVNGQWAQYLDSDFSATKGDQTLRQRIAAIDGITDVRTLDYLPATNFNCCLVEMSTETLRAVIGMEIQTVQWESLGGMVKHFKVMCIQVPQLRSDTAGNSGIAHGRTP
jgi:uncharacterized linocin/CFP29 family protein